MAMADNSNSAMRLSGLPAASDLLAVLAGCALVFLLHLYARVLPTAALAAAWLLLALPTGYGLWWQARLRRRAWLAAWLRTDASLRHRLRGGVLLLLRQAAIALVLALLLAVALTRTAGPAPWLVLLAAGPLLLLIDAQARSRAAPQVRPAFLPAFGWRVALPLAGALVTAALLLVALQQAYPDFRDVGLERAVWHLVDREQARSAALQGVLELAAAKDALRLWLGQQLMPAPGLSLAQLAGWLVLVAAEALFAWSYLLLCIGLVQGARLHDRSRR
jgi:hypothetical protein